MKKYVDLILKNGYVYNTFVQSFQKKDIAIVNDKIYLIADTIENLSSKESVDCSGKYIIPGLIDIHMHIESSMTIPSEFSKAVLPHGVTTVVADPHEIANVLGIDGLNVFLSSEPSLDIFYGIPSSVPSTNANIETTGGIVDKEICRELLNHPKILCLGEVMNFKDLVSEDNTLIKELIALCQSKNRNIPIEGHCPKITGQELAHFIYQGVDADHTQQTPESIYEKITSGMFLEIQRKSLTEETVKVLVENQFYEYFALVTDDVMADHLHDGHLNLIIKKAVELGMPLEKAIYCATYTPAKRMNLRDRGTISPGKLADLLILNDIDNLTINKVYKKGVPYMGEDIKREQFSKEAYNSVHCKLAEREDFLLKTVSQEETQCYIIQVNKTGNFTKKVTRKLPVKDGIIQWEKAGLSLVAVFERYGKTQGITLGLVEGAITEKGAIATSWAHDHHNLLVIGTNIHDMVLAQREIVRRQGGYVVYEQCELKAGITLNIGGILSDKPINEVSKELSEVRTAIRAIGYTHLNEIMSISTLSLPVSPEIKITDKGLWDTKTQKKLELEVKYNENSHY